MRYLLDTRTILWFLDNKEKISKSSLDLIEDQNNQCFISVVSLFEIVIKKNIGKLTLKYSIQDYLTALKEYGFIVLELNYRFLDNYSTLNVHSKHKDPFDRMLISVAQIDNLTLISIDQKFQLYKNIIKVIW